MFPMATSANYHHGDLRSALLDAAAEIAAERDGGELSLRAVARRAGVTHTAAYRHFADKRDLLRAVALRGFDQLALVMRDMQEQTDFTLGDIAAAYVAFAQRIPMEFGLMFDRTLCLPAGEPDALAEAGQSAQEQLARMLAERYDLSVEPSEGLAFAAWCQMHGVAVLALETPALRVLSAPELEGLARAAAAFIDTTAANQSDERGRPR